MESTDQPEEGKEMSIEEYIKHIRDKILQLEIVDNSYFKKDRATKMREMHDEIIALLDQKMYDMENSNKKIKWEYYYLRGLTLDFIPEFQKDAEETLCKAVKLRPMWNEPMRALAHVYWK